MKYIFVLDENIFLSACKGKNAHDQVDYSSSNLILQIARNCHKIAWNDELKKRYSKKADDLKNNLKYEQFMQASKIFFGLMLKLDKNIQNENYIDVDPILCDDKHVISLAVFTKGILVTEDDDLKIELQEKNLISKHNLIVVQPKEALKYADDK